MKTVIRKVLVWLLALLIPANILFPLSAAADSHSLVECRQRFGAALLQRFYAQADNRNELIKTGKLAGIYYDANGALHIAVTDETDCAAYEQLFTADMLELLAADYLATAHCRHTTDELTENVIVFEPAPHSYTKLQSIQQALTDHFTELGIWQTAVLDNENCLEICIENADDRTEVLHWLSQNTADFDESSVKIVVAPNTVSLEENIVFIRWQWYIVAMIAVSVILIATPAILLLRRHKKRRLKE